jgi:hypothetical protein
MPLTSRTLHSREKSYMQRFNRSSRFFSYGVAKLFVYEGVFPVVSVLRKIVARVVRSAARGILSLQSVVYPATTPKRAKEKP